MSTPTTENSHRFNRVTTATALALLPTLRGITAGVRVPVLEGLSAVPDRFYQYDTLRDAPRFRLGLIDLTHEAVTGGFSDGFSNGFG